MSTRRDYRKQNTKEGSHDREYISYDNITPSPSITISSFRNTTITSLAMCPRSRAFSVHQRNSADVPFIDELVKAKVPLRAGIEGEKKYSPPFGTTHSVGSVRSIPWLLGFAPVILKSVGSLVWPIMGSSPGVTGFDGGKSDLFAQPGQC